MKDSGGKFIHLFVLYHLSASITVKRRPIAREYFITHEEVLHEPPFCITVSKELVVSLQLMMEKQTHRDEMIPTRSHRIM